MAGWQELSTLVGSFDDQIGLTPLMCPANYADHLTRQGVVVRRHPNPFDLTGTSLISLSAAG
jgi:hypothetical protein